MKKPHIGVSACLARQPVRFDGSFIANPFVNNECSEFFHLHSVCPEVEMGMSTPREVIQLRDFGHEIKLVYSKHPEDDITQDMQDFAQQRIAKLPLLDGYIFKKDSPSCGVFKVPVRSHKTGMRNRNGMGIFAQAFKQIHPNVPTEDEGRLNDKGLRENFLERVYAHYRWRQIAQSDRPLQAFRDFHKNYKLIIMAKDNQAYRELGRLATSINQHNFETLSLQYFSRFMLAMSKVATQGQHVNVMQHIMGYLKSQLNSQDKKELLDWFEVYRKKRVSRVTPLTLLQHHLRCFPNQYMAEQYYFSPFPEELMLPV